MSEGTRQRIEVLQHQRRQNAARVRLAEISRQLGEPGPLAVDAERSLALQHALGDRLRELRAGGLLQGRRFAAAPEAVAAFLSCPVAMASEPFWEVYDAHGRSGFFAGPPSPAFCRACLDRGFEGFALVRSDLAAGALLDRAEDDPAFGSFYEAECW